MMMSEPRKEYYDFLLNIVFDDTVYDQNQYSKLLCLLFRTKFVRTIKMDRNRIIDGLNLRKQFMEETDIDSYAFLDTIDKKPCSVLEVMVALCQRYESQVTYDPDKGVRTPLWFFVMLSSLNVLDMTDDNFNLHECKSIIDRMMHHKYNPDGDGGLFYIPCTNKDMRTLELWNQMSAYMTEVIYKNDFEINI